MTIVQFPSGSDRKILDCLSRVMDPELGLNIVDLGLVYSASRLRGGIFIELTLTSRACPMGESVIAEVEETLWKTFPHASAVDVQLVWEPRWDPDFITERGRAILGPI